MNKNASHETGSKNGSTEASLGNGASLTAKINWVHIDATFLPVDLDRSAPIATRDSRIEL